MHVDGGCHCGYITYEAEIDPDKLGICHCTDCQTMSGSAFRVSARVPDTEFHLLSGAPKIYIKVGASGRDREQAFCPQCGTHIYAAYPGPERQDISLRLGTVRQRSELKPSRQIWCGSAQPWSGDLSDIPVVENPETL